MGDMTLFTSWQRSIKAMNNTTQVIISPRTPFFSFLTMPGSQTLSGSYSIFSQAGQKLPISGSFGSFKSAITPITTFPQQLPRSTWTVTHKSGNLYTITISQNGAYPNNIVGALFATPSPTEWLIQCTNLICSVQSFGNFWTSNGGLYDPVLVRPFDGTSDQLFEFRPVTNTRRANSDGEDDDGANLD